MPTRQQTRVEVSQGFMLLRYLYNKREKTFVPSIQLDSTQKNAEKNPNTIPASSISGLCGWIIGKSGEHCLFTLLTVITWYHLISSPVYRSILPTQSLLNLLLCETLQRYLSWHLIFISLEIKPEDAGNIQSAKEHLVKETQLAFQINDLNCHHKCKW